MHYDDTKITRYLIVLLSVLGAEIVFYKGCFQKVKKCVLRS